MCIGNNRLLNGYGPCEGINMLDIGDRITYQTLRIIYLNGTVSESKIKTGLIDDIICDVCDNIMYVVKDEPFWIHPSQIVSVE